MYRPCAPSQPSLIRPPFAAAFSSPVMTDIPDDGKFVDRRLPRGGEGGAEGFKFDSVRCGG